MSFAIKTLFIDSSVLETEPVINVVSKLRAPVWVTDNIKDIHEMILMDDDPIGAGKKYLYLTRNKGAFIKDCPGTKCYTCCDYVILHVGTFCTMDCSYCILQSYFHPPFLQFFLNWEDLDKELEARMSEKGMRRYGTGEFTDSLIWEPFFSGLTQKLVKRFAGQSHAVLELKTKSTEISNLKNLDHNGKTIISFSLNTERMIKSQERRTASLTARLKAAAQCVEWGYPIGFHFDPVIIYDNALEEYQNVIEKMFSYVPPEKIVWISIGTFRFMPALKSIIQKRFDRSNIIYGEFIQGLDNKMRYFKPLRIDITKGIISAIRKIDKNVTVYFCMEDDEIWRKTLGFTADEKGGLPHMLDESARRLCSLK